MEKAASQDHQELLAKLRSGKEGCCHNQTATPNIALPVSALWLNSIGSQLPRGHKAQGQAEDWVPERLQITPLQLYSQPVSILICQPSCSQTSPTALSDTSGETMPASVMRWSRTLLTCHYWLLPTRNTWLRAGIIFQQCGFSPQVSPLQTLHPQMLNVMMLQESWALEGPEISPVGSAALNGQPNTPYGLSAHILTKPYPA